MMPIDRTADAPGLYINLALIAVMVAGLILSLRDRATGRGTRAA
jgi:hypothetical protein